MPLNTNTTIPGPIYDRQQPLSAYRLQEGAVLLINKPLRWTSFDVVKKLRAVWGVKKVGHAGTLDPLATGLLIVCTGAQTKAVGDYQGMDKVYRGEMLLGKTTPSVDLETDFDSETPYQHITTLQLQKLTTAFEGSIQQVPPIYSAVKQGGARAYKKARQGKDITLAPREVAIHHFSLIDIALPKVTFEVVCGKGTYIRSLVRDFGQQLGVGACMSALCRTQIGAFHLQDAYTIDALSQKPM